MRSHSRLVLLTLLSSCSAIAHQVQHQARSTAWSIKAGDGSPAPFRQPAAPETVDPHRTFQGLRGIFLQSFFVVAVAELFDKTWFVAVICSLNHGKGVAFIGSVLALFLHVGLAAGLGATISKFFSLSMLHFVTAAVFGTLFVLYAYELIQADPEKNALKERSEEAKDTMTAVSQSSPTWQKLMSCFMAVFVAEWGDRTQVAMISLHSSNPLLPVCAGSLVAFLLLSATATLVAALLEGYNISERLICGVSAASFLIFAIMAVFEGFQAHALEHAARV